ncbi:hypothetical protein LTR56_008775 [Elasticomyces elasticus]|nr:hypothetical protein LTR22_017560 [Elasticomyces elasticus]KAK3646157.1 hypothetical protein LTR56_008775 [Elasticomyces elasticus]KAK4924338.1 hypothetical protein LTR49_008639 [Elasticomyces elasticus]
MKLTAEQLTALTSQHQQTIAEMQTTDWIQRSTSPRTSNKSTASQQLVAGPFRPSQYQLDVRSSNFNSMTVIPADWKFVEENPSQSHPGWVTDDRTETTFRQQGDELARIPPSAAPNKPTDSMVSQPSGLPILTPGSDIPNRSNLRYVLNDEPEGFSRAPALAAMEPQMVKGRFPEAIYIHYEMVCGFCPGSGALSLRTFKRAEVFKRHLMAAHGVEQIPPESIRIPQRVDAAICLTCEVSFTDTQRFYEHLDDCVLRYMSETPAADLAATAQPGLDKQLWRTESQAYQDALFNPTTEFGPTPTASSKLADPLHVSTHRNLLMERLQAADLARSRVTPSIPQGQLPFQDGSPLKPLEWVQQGQSESSFGPVGTVWPGDALLEFDGEEHGDEQPFLSQHDATSAEYGMTAPSLPVTHYTPADSNAMAVENRQGGYNDGNSMSIQYGLFPSQFDSESHTSILDADDSQCLDNFFDHPDLMQPPRATGRRFDSRGSHAAT